MTIHTPKNQSPEQELLRKVLKEAGCSITSARLELLAALQQPVAPKTTDLVKWLPNQDQATIYRNIKLFEKLGMVQIIQFGWQSRVKLSSRFAHHHHYLRCSSCQLIIKLPNNPQLEEYLLNTGRQKNFSNLDHQVEISGLCPACQTK